MQKNATKNTLDLSIFRWQSRMPKSLRNTQWIKFLLSLLRWSSINTNTENGNEIIRDIDENTIINDSLNDEPNFEQEVEQTIDNDDFQLCRIKNACVNA